MQAIGYARVSTEEQAKEGISMDLQRDKIRAYADLKGLDLVEIIEDAGLSAKDLKRPGVQRVIEAARRRQVEAVVVFKLDRMFRDAADALTVTKAFDKRGVAFHSICETLDTRSAMGRFFFTVLAGFAEMERAKISERTREAMQHKRANNERVGNIPFGWDLDGDNGQLVANEDEQHVIQRIHELRAEGLSLRDIAGELDDAGIQTKQGRRRWSAKVVRDILRRHVA